jgi:hypothetical protein
MRKLACLLSSMLIATSPVPVAARDWNRVVAQGGCEALVTLLSKETRGFFEAWARNIAVGEGCGWLYDRWVHQPQTPPQSTPPLSFPCSKDSDCGPGWYCAVLLGSCSIRLPNLRP